MTSLTRIPPERTNTQKRRPSRHERGKHETTHRCSLNIIVRYCDHFSTCSWMALLTPRRSGQQQHPDPCGFQTSLHAKNIETIPQDGLGFSQLRWGRRLFHPMEKVKSTAGTRSSSTHFSLLLCGPSLSLPAPLRFQVPLLL